MTLFVEMTDDFMSGWGQAEGKKNIFVVKCDNEDEADQIVAAAEERGEMSDISILLFSPQEREGIVFTRRAFASLTGDWKA